MNTTNIVITFQEKKKQKYNKELSRSYHDDTAHMHQACIHLYVYIYARLLYI